MRKGWLTTAAKNLKKATFYVLVSGGSFTCDEGVMAEGGMAYHDV
jgi:hypothetical protein